MIDGEGSLSKGVGFQGPLHLKYIEKKMIIKPRLKILVSRKSQSLIDKSSKYELKA